jgi:hypothetical protein
MKAPKQMCTKGKNEGCETAVLEIRICKDANGFLWSLHNWQSKEDETLVKGWPEGGAKQVAHSLLTEAFRREMFALVLGELTADKNYMLNYNKSSESAKKQTEEKLSAAMAKLVKLMAERMGPDLSVEILNMLSKK